MNKYEFPIKFENEYVEAEIVGRKENITAESKNLFSRIVEKLKRMLFSIFFVSGFLLIFLGSVLCATVIGMIIGLPIIVSGIVLIFIGVKLYLSIVYRKIH